MVPGRGLAVWRCGIHKEHRVAKNLRGDRKRAGCGARARSAGVAQASAGALATARAAWRGASAAGLGGTGGPGAVTSLWLGGEGRWQDRVRRPFRDRELAVVIRETTGQSVAAEPERGDGLRRGGKGTYGTWTSVGHGGRGPEGAEDSPTRPARAVAGGDGLRWDAGPGERSVHCSGTEAPWRHPRAVGPTSRELRLGGAGRAGVGLGRQDWADSTRQSGARREPGSPQRPGCRGARQDHHAAALRAASRGTFDALTGAEPRPPLSRRGPRALGVHGPVTRPACLGQRDRDGGAWSARGRGWAATGQPQHPSGPRAWLSLTARRGTQRRGLPTKLRTA